MCVSRTVSVGIRVPSWGYEEHGHDLEIWACFRPDGRVDIEGLRSLLARLLDRYDHRPLWRVLGEDALIEDLLEDLCSSLERSLAESHASARPILVEARFASSRIIIECDDEDHSRRGARL